MRENLEPSLKLMFGHEGGYVNVKTDKGGPTKYGITHKTLAMHRGVKSVTADMVKKMTINEAEDIYRRSYWGPSGGDVLPVGLDYMAFDFGVNSGPLRAVKSLQKVLGVKQDGWIGSETLAAVASYPGGSIALIKAYAEARMAFFRSIKGPQGFSANGRGWTIRVLGTDPKGQWKAQPGVLGNAIAMAARKPLRKDTSTVAAQTVVSEEGSAKAEPSAIDAYLKPEVLLPGAGAAGSAVLPFIGEIDLIKVAIAIAIIAAVGVGVLFAYKRIKATS